MSAENMAGAAHAARPDERSRIAMREGID